MGIKGKFDDITLPDVFQVISISRKSGKLVVAGESRRAVIIFDEGRIVQAQIDGYRKNIGRLLLQKKFVSKAQINEALHIQSELDEWKQVGQICLDRGFISRAQLEEAVKTLISEIIMELLSWKEGVLNFEAGKVDIDDDISLDMRELILRSGLSSDSVLMEGAKMLDEKMHYEGLSNMATSQIDEEEVKIREARKKRIKEGWLTSFARGVLEDIDISFLDHLLPREPEKRIEKEKKKKGITQIYTEIRMLKDILKRVNDEDLWQEFCFSVMKFASELVGRVVLFLVKDGFAYGIGHMGFTELAASADEDIRLLRIPLSESSVLKEVYESKESIFSKIDATEHNKILLQAIGTEKEKEVLVIPVLVEDKTRFLLYADNNPSDEPLTNIDLLESYIYQASMALEIAMLERNLRK